MTDSKYPELFLNGIHFPFVTIDWNGDYDIETSDFVHLQVGRHLHRFKHNGEIVYLPHLAKIGNRGEERKGHATKALQLLTKATGMNFWCTTYHMEPDGIPFFKKINESDSIQFNHMGMLRKMGYEFQSERPSSLYGYQPDPS